jgi:hypothetical protein
LLDNFSLKVELLQELSAEGEIAGKLTQIKASNSLIAIISSLILDYVDQNANQI